MNRLATVLFTALAAVPAAAQGTRIPFPLTVHPEDTGPGLRLAERPGALGELSRSKRTWITMTDVPGPEGALVDLELERVELDFDETQLFVDGRREPAGLSSESLSLWAGTVAGESDSEVFLGFSEHGSRGWIRVAGERTHLLSGPDENAGWTAPVQRFMHDDELDRDAALSLLADQDPLAVAPNATLPVEKRSSQLGPVGTLECRMAWETDFQLYEAFNDFNALQDYVMHLLGAVNFRFRGQVDVVLTPAYIGLYTNANDPWSTPDNFGSPSDLLLEFSAAWQGNVPAGADLAHFVSGAPLGGGGISYLDALCSPDFNFAVSSNVTRFGLLPGGPPMQGPMTFDFHVISHELGHCFTSPNTRDYAPPIDDCPNVCSSQGTIMSDCNLCPPGISNLTTFFHPRVVDVMRNAAESCLPSVCRNVSNYCVSTPNSNSVTGAVMSGLGDTSVTNNNFSLAVNDAGANKTGLFFYGGSQLQTAFGDGFRCVGAGGLGTFRLYPLVTTDAWGSVTRPLDFTAPPANAGAGAIGSGSTWYFQFWFRDPMGGPSGFNLSDGLAVEFCP